MCIFMLVMWQNTVYFYGKLYTLKYGIKLNTNLKINSMNIFSSRNSSTVYITATTAAGILP